MISDQIELAESASSAFYAHFPLELLSNTDTLAPQGYRACQTAPPVQVLRSTANGYNAPFRRCHYTSPTASLCTVVNSSGLHESHAKSRLNWQLRLTNPHALCSMFLSLGCTSGLLLRLLLNCAEMVCCYAYSWNAIHQLSGCDQMAFVARLNLQA